MSAVGCVRGSDKAKGISNEKGNGKLCGTIGCVRVPRVKAWGWASAVFAAQGAKAVAREGTSSARTPRPQQ